MTCKILTNIVALLLLLSCAHAQKDNALNQTETGISFREARRGGNTFLDSCLTNTGTSGTCMSRFKCMRQMGTASGYCGTYGVCCETNMQCGTSSRLKRTIIRNPSLFNTNVCQYTIEAYSLNVRQLRIDFEQFQLQQPTTSTIDPTRIECVEYFEAGKFQLCGENSGQHIYLPFNAGSGQDTITIEFNIPTRSAQASWRLIVTQLEAPIAKKKNNILGAFGGATANNLQDIRGIFASHHADFDLLAPDGCDQYYTTTTGTIKSFNYQPAMGRNYMPDLTYTICIRALSGANMIQYTFGQFSLGIQSNQVQGFDEVCHGAIYTEGRQQDYLMIPQSEMVTNGMPTSYQPTYYCGLNDNIVVYAAPPFMMQFSSDAYTYDPTKELGFSLNYRIN